jgi:hypothetical protein
MGGLGLMGCDMFRYHINKFALAQKHVFVQENTYRNGKGINEKARNA